MNNSLFPIHAGFLPLLDSAILVAASEKGFAQTEGIDLCLVRENSWANIRDRMAVGHFEVAHMLAPMPIAAKLGLTPMPLDIIAPMALGLGGNAITVTKELSEEMDRYQNSNLVGAALAGFQLGKAISSRTKLSDTKPIFAVVHPHSVHNYELRYWLQASGIVPDMDIDIVVIPPSLMPDALKAKRIDGFCVGEPWNSVATATCDGVMITTKSDIWRSSPEKVLGVSCQFANKNPNELKALIRALVHAAQWCGQSENHGELAQILSQPKYVGTDIDAIKPSLSGIFNTNEGIKQQINDFFIPFERAATFPWQSHAAWFYSQMVRWGQVDWDPSIVNAISETYRPDIYRNALSELEFSVPSANSKVEGSLPVTTFVGSNNGKLSLGPDGFFDGKIFDPSDIQTYIESQRAAG